MMDGLGNEKQRYGAAGQVSDDGNQSEKCVQSEANVGAGHGKVVVQEAGEAFDVLMIVAGEFVLP